MCEEVTIHPFCLDRGCKIYNAVIGLQNRKHSSISTDGWWLLQSLFEMFMLDGWGGKWEEPSVCSPGLSLSHWATNRKQQLLSLKSTFIWTRFSLISSDRLWHLPVSVSPLTRLSNIVQPSRVQLCFLDLLLLVESPAREFLLVWTVVASGFSSLCLWYEDYSSFLDNASPPDPAKWFVWFLAVGSFKHSRKWWISQHPWLLRRWVWEDRLCLDRLNCLCTKDVNV